MTTSRAWMGSPFHVGKYLCRWRMDPSWTRMVSPHQYLIKSLGAISCMWTSHVFALFFFFLPPNSSRVYGDITEESSRDISRVARLVWVCGKIICPGPTCSRYVCTSPCSVTSVLCHLPTIRRILFLSTRLPPRAIPAGHLT